jgi:hypothetical protein
VASRDFLRGFADDLDAPNRGTLQRLVREKLLASQPGSCAREEIGLGEHVPQIFKRL